MINQSSQSMNFLAAQLNRVIRVISGKCYLNQVPVCKFLKYIFHKNVTKVTINHCILRVIKYNMLQVKNIQVQVQIPNSKYKCNKVIGVTKKLLCTLLRNTVSIIYKSFVISNLDYTDIIYDKQFNEAYKNKLRWYNIALLL